VTNSNRKKKVLIVVANPSTSPVTGWPVGFWWAELTRPYWAFTEAGYEVEIRSPHGGDLLADGCSDPEDPSGYSAHDILSLGFKKSPKHLGLLENTSRIDDYRVSVRRKLARVGSTAGASMGESL
jgi:putative intracellular protease/amidase